MFDYLILARMGDRNFIHTQPGWAEKTREFYSIFPKLYNSKLIEIDWFDVDWFQVGELFLFGYRSLGLRC